MKSFTVFFAIDRGLVARNILRSGVLDKLLEQPNTRAVILLPKKAEGIPAYLHEEFSDPRIFLEEVPERRDSFWLVNVWLPVVNNFVYTDFTDMLARDGSGKVKPVPKWRYPMHSRLYRFLSKFKWLKSLTRELDFWLFRAKGFEALFKKYEPSVMFCGSIVSKYDVALLKAARKFGVPTIGMQKGWDNLQKQLIRHVPDRFLIQNALMSEAAEEVQMIDALRIQVVGFPQFDPYANKRISGNQEVKTIFFGSEGLWTPQDDLLLEKIIQWQERGAFPFKTRIIARPHFSNIRKGLYDRFKGKPQVFIDDGYRYGTYFSDAWDPSKQDYRHFVDELCSSDVMVTYASTLSLDAACIDLPVINITYGSFEKDGKDLTSNLYKADHYLPVVESQAVEMTDTDEQLRAAIIRSIEEPSYRAAGRKKLRDTMCGILDGKSAERIANHILSYRV